MVNLIEINPGDCLPPYCPIKYLHITHIFACAFFSFSPPSLYKIDNYLHLHTYAYAFSLTHNTSPSFFLAKIANKVAETQMEESAKTKQNVEEAMESS